MESINQNTRLSSLPSYFLWWFTWSWTAVCIKNVCM